MSKTIIDWDKLSFIPTIEQISEGRYKTYPINKVIEYLQRRFLNSPISFNKVFNRKSKPNENGELIIIKCLTSKENFEILNKTLESCGYVSSLKDNELFEKFSNGDKLGEFIFEPRYNIINNNGLNGITTLYHISPSIYEEKILRYGLQPRSKSKKANHPERVYLMKTKSDEKVQNMILQLSNYEANSVQRNGNEYTVYEINIDKLDGKVIFYQDPMIDMGVYTCENMPPQAIKIFWKYKIY